MVTLLPNGNVMIIANASSVIYTYSTATHLLAQTAVAVPGLPHPIVYPYTASVVMLPLSPTTGYNPQVLPWLPFPDAEVMTVAPQKNQHRPDLPHPNLYPYTASVVMLPLGPTTGYNPQVRRWLPLS